MKLFVGALLITLSALCFPANAADAPLLVVASFSILADMAHNIGGDAVGVTALVGPDGDAHSYQPTPQDAKTIAEADVIIVNGLGFDDWMHRLIKAANAGGRIAVASYGVMALIDNDRSIKNHSAVDPHAWQDIANGRIYIKNIADALEKARPKQARAIRKRAEAYDHALEEADRFVRGQFADIPAAKRKIITSHDAFGYFGAAYGVTFLAPVGMNTEAEPSAADVAQLMAQIKREGVRQLFLENMTNAKLIEQIARDTGASMGGTLYSDALSPPDGPAPTYLSMFYNNAPKLRAAMLMNGVQH